MAHRRKRFLKHLLTKAVTHSSIVEISGHRQTGKTTLVEDFGAEYVTLDRPKEFLLANDNPEAFLLQRKYPFVIDECQLAPPLFPVLKDSVRLKKTPGQYILTGSVRFTSRKAIRESLTGHFQIHWFNFKRSLILKSGRGRLHFRTDTSNSWIITRWADCLVFALIAIRRSV